MKKLCVITLIILTAALFASCGEAGGAADTGTAPTTILTDEFRQFLEIRKSRPQTSRTEEKDGYAYSLDGGVLRVFDETGSALWQSEDGWYVEDFRLGDVDGDGNAEVLFTPWKSYSFGPNHPARMKNDDPAVQCHLFLYTVRGGHMKSVWCSSGLPRPIYAFELSLDGEKNPVASGAVLRTVEGRYREDFSRGEGREYVYVWRGWGFVEE